MKKDVTVGHVYVTYWLTRDADPDGNPAAFVDIWWSRPVRHQVGDRGGFWLDRMNGLADHHGAWTVDAARALGTCPDDGTQCIRVGPESASRDALATIKPGEA